MRKRILQSATRIAFIGLILTAFLQGDSLAQVSTDTMASFTNIPINLTGNDVAPLVMMNVSRDHQLSYKAYNDYSDLDGDKDPEITYEDTITYYGYFDSAKCYTYDNSAGVNRFVPDSPATGTNSHYCSKKWSGNFMNWATMTRMDVVRKLLYGGQRSTDTSTLTVLERHYLPTDAHSFAKYYNGTDIDQLTPFTGITTGITLANLTLGSTSGVNRYSDTNTNAPLIRVAKGNFSLWAANERWQCYWSEEQSTTGNGNIAAISGIGASSSNPSRATHGLGNGIAVGAYVARIEVAVTGLHGQEKLKEYGTSYKPIGLLQVYGDSDQIFFGLLTGSFSRNISGGVLRKNVTSFSDEINSLDGTFDTSANGIVHNLNRIRIYGYDYNDGTYQNRDDCTFQQTGLVASGGSEVQGQPANEGNCSSWGNPMSEMYLESLRYLAGDAANTDFAYGAVSNDATLGLTVATWADPLDQTNYCAALNVLNFNASVSSYDGNQMTGISDLGSPFTAAALTNAVGVFEKINSSSWFIGSNGTTSNDLCSSKDIGSGFGSYSGLCPEAPTQEGTYLLSGIAHYANTHPIRTDLTIPASRANSRDLMVSTYGIALATNVPKIEVVAGNNAVTILPAYRLDVSSHGTGPFGGGTLVDFKIIENTATHG